MFCENININILKEVLKTLILIKQVVCPWTCTQRRVKLTEKIKREGM